MSTQSLEATWYFLARDTRDFGLTCVPAGHEEHGKVAPTDRRGRQADDIPDYDRPPGDCKVKESLAGSVYRIEYAV